ncbi:MAG: HEAT repeat domain-containing protein [Armatimonadota bacterium]
MTPTEPIAAPDSPTPRSRFIDSMTMNFDMWHDGTGYDIDALRNVPNDEVPALVTLLSARQPRDWRDIEALGVLGTPKAREAITAALTDPDPHVRRYAAAYVGPPDDPDREALLVKALESDVFFGGLTPALEEVEEFHPPKVIDALLDGALNREGEVAVHFAAMLYFLHGKSKEAFDWEHRPFFLRFHTDDSAERLTVFRELCAAIGADSTKFARRSLD